MHIRDKLAELYSVRVVFLPVRVILLGEPLFNDSSLLKQAVGDDTGIALGKILIPHRERRERTIRHETVYAGVSRGICRVRRVD